MPPPRAEQADYPLFERVIDGQIVPIVGTIDMQPGIPPGWEPFLEGDESVAKAPKNPKSPKKPAPQAEKAVPPKKGMDTSKKGGKSC
jgi:hypothetical protein